MILYELSGQPRGSWLRQAPSLVSLALQQVRSPKENISSPVMDMKKP